MVTHGAASTVRWRVAAIMLGVAAALCLAAGIALPYIAAGVFERKLADLLPISPTSVSYSSWVSSELRFQVWMWNVTNAREVLNSDAAPNLAQVGPFTFRETRVREEVQFYDNRTVGYDDVRTFYFLPEESVGSMSDYRITNVNLPYIGVALRTSGKSISYRKILQNFLKSDVFTTRTVEELLLGYEDTKMRGLSTMARYFGGMKVPSRFGIMLGKNGTAKGSALVGTGSGNIGELNRVHLWNRQPNLKIWRQDWANELVGTDGTMFPPPIGPDDTLAVFTSDLCRSANMTYRRTSTVQGITVLAFSPAKTALMNATGNPHNAAFCTPRCLDSGVLNLSLCLPGGPPIVASAPHFYGAPTYAAAVTGVSPGASHEFETRLELEPNTGLLLRAARRMQKTSPWNSWTASPTRSDSATSSSCPTCGSTRAGQLAPSRRPGSSSESSGHCGLLTSSPGFSWLSDWLCSLWPALSAAWNCGSGRRSGCRDSGSSSSSSSSSRTAEQVSLPMMPPRWRLPSHSRRTAAGRRSRRRDRQSCVGASLKLRSCSNTCPRRR